MCPIQPAADRWEGLREVASGELEPQAGITNVERRYDGEYCRIHIDLNRSGS
jgi:hypothetical protein